MPIYSKGSLADGRLTYTCQGVDIGYIAFVWACTWLEHVTHGVIINANIKIRNQRVPAVVRHPIDHLIDHACKDDSIDIKIVCT